MTDNESVLSRDIRGLTEATRELHTLLENNYPKRSEVEERYATKYSQQRVVINICLALVLAAVLTVIVTIGSYAACFTGDSSPGICTYVPGYEERIERRDMVDAWNDAQDREINRLLKKNKMERSVPRPPILGDDE